MKFWNRLLVVFIGMVGMVTHLQATHNRAGEITYRQIGPLSIEITVTTYTKASSDGADRDSIEIFWGDGTSEFIQRTNGGGEGEELGNDTKLNLYVKTHDYPGRATYTIGFKDPNRVEGILNVNYPNSVDVEFFLSTTFTLLDPQFQGENNSAVLLQPPLDVACANKVFIHNPNAYDPDGDSLSYELVVPKMNAEEDVPDYLYPDEISPGPTNNISLNPVTGSFTWNTPKQQGEYNIAIRINEWRKGVLLNSIIRDMQILVVACENDPPTIDVIEELCVIAGEKISLPIIVDDPNTGDSVLLSATGGPFIVDSDSAYIIGPQEKDAVAFTATFEWQTNCNHVSNQYYQVALRAVDDFFPDGSGLATIKTLRIKVVAPPPENLSADSELAGIRLTWDKPYSCENTEDEYFQGFSVWRKVGSTSFDIDTCTSGLEGRGYQKIVFLTNQMLNGSYTTFDDNVEKGITYCYRVLAEFAQSSFTGNPYNRVQSLPSNETCQQLVRDIPIITKVSIDNTDDDSGQVHIRWAKPLKEDLDTIANPPPYRYELYRSLDNALSFDLIPDFTITTMSLSETIDTNFFDSNINTRDLQPQYLIRFFSNGNEYGVSPEVTSTFLTISPSDRSLFLEWNEFVPWSKIEFDIFWREPGSSDYDSLTTVANQSYEQLGLENGEEYCYYIRAIGSYNIDDIEDPLINLSQEVCTEPVDNVPPCPPILQVANVCEEGVIPDDINELINTLIYTRPNAACPETNDVEGYYIYYSEIEGQELIRIDSIFDEEQNRYEHNPITGISGCYAISAFDENGNESPLSNIVCVDNCPAYELPNTFTPNGDGANELFVPRVNRFVDRIEFVLHNEWGNKIFETTDPQINWDGLVDGNQAAEGTYYYTCRIYEQRVSGILESTEILKGYIHLIR